MALHFDLKVNGRAIATVEIVRRLPAPGVRWWTEDYRLAYQYDWVVNTNVGNTTKSLSAIRSGEVTHVYDEGAFELVRKVMEGYLHQISNPPTELVEQ